MSTKYAELYRGSLNSVFAGASVGLPRLAPACHRSELVGQLLWCFVTGPWTAFDFSNICHVSIVWHMWQLKLKHWGYLKIQAIAHAHLHNFLSCLTMAHALSGIFGEKFQQRSLSCVRRLRRPLLWSFVLQAGQFAVESLLGTHPFQFHSKCWQSKCPGKINSLAKATLEQMKLHMELFWWCSSKPWAWHVSLWPFLCLGAFPLEWLHPWRNWIALRPPPLAPLPAPPLLELGSATE